MLTVCVKHQATCCNGRWEFHTKPLHELNICGPLTISECQVCKHEKQLELDFIKRTIKGNGVEK